MVVYPVDNLEDIQLRSEMYKVVVACIFNPWNPTANIPMNFMEDFSEKFPKFHFTKGTFSKFPQFNPEELPLYLVYIDSKLEQKYIRNHEPFLRRCLEWYNDTLIFSIPMPILVRGSGPEATNTRAQSAPKLEPEPMLVRRPRALTTDIPKPAPTQRSAPARVSSMRGKDGGNFVHYSRRFMS